MFSTRTNGRNAAFLTLLKLPRIYVLTLITPQVSGLDILMGVEVGQFVK